MNKITHIILTLTVCGLLSGGTLFYVYNWAKPQIDVNDAKQREADSKIVLVAATKFIEVKTKVDGIDFSYYQGVDNSGKLVGYVVPCTAKGFQSTIIAMIGVNADLKNIAGVQIRHFETPGYGDILSTPFFLDQLKNLATDENCQIGFIKKGTGTPKETEIETKTGATVSQSAAVRAINSGLANLKKALGNNITINNTKEVSNDENSKSGGK